MFGDVPLHILSFPVIGKRQCRHAVRLRDVMTSDLQLVDHRAVSDDQPISAGDVPRQPELSVLVARHDVIYAERRRRATAFLEDHFRVGIDS